MMDPAKREMLCAVRGSVAAARKALGESDMGQGLKDCLNALFDSVERLAGCLPGAPEDGIEADAVFGDDVCDFDFPSFGPTGPEDDSVIEEEVGDEEERIH